MTPGAGIFRTTLPAGFLAGGINCGVRRYRPDLGLIYSELPCVTTGVYTQNTCQAAPIRYCAQVLPSTEIRAILTNSGQANAGTGKLGEQHNLDMVKALADQLGCQPEQVLTASTGVIGEPLEIEKITLAIPTLTNSLTTIAENFALAILTTDLVPKTVHKTITLSTGDVTLTGICKGSGMIHPNMATMLGYLLTDAKLSVPQSSCLLKTICDESFNMISVDGEMSTNDCVFLMSNGASEHALNTQADYDLFLDAAKEVAITLAKSIARDGEGASKLIEVQVKGLDDLAIAKEIARALTKSPLIKTAIYGQSPNWGRILAAVGSTSITESVLSKCVIAIQDLVLFAAGEVNEAVSRNALQQRMKQDTIVIALDFQSGTENATAWGCDLTEKYVSINAEYLS